MTIQGELAQLDACYEIDIRSARTTVEADIHKTITQLHEKLNARKTELISQLYQSNSGKAQ